MQHIKVIISCSRFVIIIIISHSITNCQFFFYTCASHRLQKTLWLNWFITLLNRAKISVLIPRENCLHRLWTRTWRVNLVPRISHWLYEMLKNKESFYELKLKQLHIHIHTRYIGDEENQLATLVLFHKIILSSVENTESLICMIFYFSSFARVRSVRFSCEKFRKRAWRVCVYRHSSPSSPTAPQNYNLCPRGLRRSATSNGIVAPPFGLVSLRAPSFDVCLFRRARLGSRRRRENRRSVVSRERDETMQETKNNNNKRRRKKSKQNESEVARASIREEDDGRLYDIGRGKRALGEELAFARVALS